MESQEAREESKSVRDEALKGEALPLAGGEALLRTENLTKRFAGLTAVERVNLVIYPGEVVGLVGDNGAGKSTLIKLLCGVYQPDEGRIFFQGREVRFLSPGQAREIGIETVHQDLALVENMDVSANIFIGRELVRCYLGGLVKLLDRRSMDREARRLLAELDIPLPSLRCKIKSLSEGQRRAVALARALRWKARLLLLDEPTAALSIREQIKVRELIRTLSREGAAVVVVSHELANIFSVAVRILVMHRGRVVEERLTAETAPQEIAALLRKLRSQHPEPGLQYSAI